MSSLYLQHFGLRQPPFRLTPDPEFFFSGGQRGSLLDALCLVAEEEDGIAVVVSEVGCGKTMLARQLVSRLQDRMDVVYLPNPCMSRQDILQAVAWDMGLMGTPADGAPQALLLAIQAHLLRRHGQGRRVLMVVDEAHAMPMESLEEVRRLSNLETAKDKLINIVLFGQPELIELLSRVEMRPVLDRVSHRLTVQPWSEPEAARYVHQRLQAAGAATSLFEPVALSALCRLSKGRARRIHLLAEKALLSAFARGYRCVTLQDVHEALGELPRDAADGMPAPHGGASGPEANLSPASELGDGRGDASSTEPPLPERRGGESAGAPSRWWRLPWEGASPRVWGRRLKL
jgi:type II secretory pathway predicted ATPase ExeA